MYTSVSGEYNSGGSKGEPGRARPTQLHFAKILIVFILSYKFMFIQLKQLSNHLEFNFKYQLVTMSRQLSLFQSTNGKYHNSLIMI